MSKKRISAAFSTILERFIETYLGEDKPKMMSWRSRYACAWFGIAFFALVAWFAAPRALADTGPTVTIIRDMVLSTPGLLIIVMLPVLVVSLLACVIASGIDRGGPIRLFLVGVTLPALVFYFATLATDALPAQSGSPDAAAASQ